MKKLVFPRKTPVNPLVGGRLAKMAMSPGPEAVEVLFLGVETDEPAILGEIKLLGGILSRKTAALPVKSLRDYEPNYRSIAVFLTPHYNESKLGQMAIPRDLQSRS
jgi:hypothetical protein